VSTPRKFYWWRKPEYHKKVPDKLYHNKYTSPWEWFEPGVKKGPGPAICGFGPNIFYSCLCLNCFTNMLNIIGRITASVKRKTDLKLFCYNHPGCVCSVNFWRFIQNKTHFNHANEIYEVNMWGKYWKISRICNKKDPPNNSALLKGTTNMQRLTVW
jgi:hypothetical protein